MRIPDLFNYCDRPFRNICLLLICSILISLGCQESLNKNKGTKKPNILFILADDLGYHDLSCMGSTFYETPNIDRIASNGVTFTNGYATCQVCSPSRASIMTGKFPARHGITDWLGAKTGENWRRNKRYSRLLPPPYEPHLSHDDNTIAEVFKSNGYNTFFAGKWHLGEKGSYPEDHGFDINQGGYEKGGPYSGGFFSPFNNPKMEDHPGELGMSLSVKLAKETIQFIESNDEEPFFAYLSFYAVHAPIQTSQEKWSRYQAKAEAAGIKDSGFQMERRLPIRTYQDNPVYAGLIEQMDDGVGLVLDKLKELGLDDNTIVIFTSDNGGVASGDNFSTSNAPLRGGKGYQWEGGLRVPYLVYVPWLNYGPNNGQRKNDSPVTGTDFFPSLLELCGLDKKPNQHIDGRSFVKGLSGATLPKRSLVWHYPHYGNQGGDPSAVIRKGRWKLIHYFEDGGIELYHVIDDFSESNNVVDNYPDVAKDLKIELEDRLTEMGARFPVPDTEYNKDSAQVKRQYYEDELMTKLEDQRKDFLNEDWQPNADWWGSQNTKD